MSSAPARKAALVDEAGLLDANDSAETLGEGDGERDTPAR